MIGAADLSRLCAGSANRCTWHVGTWATQEGAVSATGHGEGIIRYGLSRTAVERMKAGDASQAVRAVVEEARRDGVEVGLIGVDAEGGLGWAFNSEQMGVASWSES